MRFLVLVCGSALCLAGCAGEPIAIMPDGSPIYSRAFAPTAEDGSATVECMIVDNTLRDCKAIAESPEGCGHGDLAVTVLEGQPLTSRADATPPTDNRMRVTMAVRGRC